MTKQTINVGTSPNDNRGDSLRASFQKINANFTELYTALGINADVTLNIGAFEFAGSVMSTTDSSAIVIDQAVTVSSNLTVGGDVLPSVALGGDLGSSARPWRSLYVSNNTIFLGGTALSVNGAGNLLVNGSQITGGTTSYNDLTNKPTIPTSFDRLVNGAYELVVETDGIISSVAFPERDGGKVYLSGVELFAVPADPESTDPFPLILSSQQGNVRIKSNAIGPMFEWRFGTDGDLEIPGNIKSNGNINIEINIGDSTLRRWQFGEDGALTFPDGTNQTTAWTGSTTVSSLVNGARTVSLGSDGALTIPGDIRSEGNINIDINLADSTLRRWQFGEDGNLTLPAGGNISEGGGLTGAIRLTPAGGANANQALLIYPTAQVEGDHIHLTAGGGTTELYLGSDLHYVKLGKGAPYNGTIVIAATGWPNTVAGIISSGNWAVVSLSNLATTGGTGTGLTVTVTQVAGVATAIAIVSGPMAGYTINDTITVTSGAATATFVITVLAPQWIFAPDGDLYLPPGNIIRDLGNGNDIRSIPGPYADDAAAQAAGVAVGNPYHKTGTSGQVFVRLT